MKKLSACLPVCLSACLPVCLSVGTAFAVETTILGATLFEKGAQRLSIDESKALVQAGTEVEQINGGTGGIRRWTLGADGKFIASRVAATGSLSVTGRGEWKLTENGQFCVQIEWRPRSGAPELENWCRVLYRYENVMFLAPADLANVGERKYGQILFKK